MRFWSIILFLVFTPFAIASSLMAQSVASNSAPQGAMPDANEKALLAERRSELLRQEASNAESTEDRLIAQRAVLSAEIDAAEAQIEAATARVAIISRRQKFQRAQLGVESEPVLRLNAALQQMTARPAVLMMMQPGQREDYVHVRAVMATVQPQIIRRTSALRQQIAVQSELRAQEYRALKSLDDARGRLKSRQTDLARLQGEAGGKAGALSANAAGGAMRSSPMRTWRASGRRRDPWQAGHVCTARYLPSSSRTADESVSFQRRSRFGMTPSKG